MIYDQKYYEHSDWYLWSRRTLAKQNREWVRFSMFFAFIFFAFGTALGIVLGATVLS